MCNVAEYIALANEQRQKKKKAPIQFQMIDWIEFLPDVNSLDENIQNLVVFDDMITEKKQEKIEEYFIRGRKRNCSVIYISHRYYDTPKKIRTNSSCLVIFKLTTKRELKALVSDYGTRLGDETFLKLYRECTKDKHGFMFIDNAEEDPALAYRCGLDNFYTGTAEN